jgi:hypothetical protein
MPEARDNATADGAMSVPGVDDRLVVDLSGQHPSSGALQRTLYVRTSVQAAAPPRIVTGRQLRHPPPVVHRGIRLIPIWEWP